MTRYLLLFFLFSSSLSAQHRVFIYTDINLVGGDPDDRQSLIHLLWYANELQIEGIVPDYWNGKGYEACIDVLNEYKKDYQDFDFVQKGYPAPETVKSWFATDKPHAEKNAAESRGSI